MAAGLRVFYAAMEAVQQPGYSTTMQEEPFTSFLAGMFLPFCRLAYLCYACLPMLTGFDIVSPIEEPSIVRVPESAVQGGESYTALSFPCKPSCVWLQPSVMHNIMQ